MGTGGSAVTVRGGRQTGQILHIPEELLQEGTPQYPVGQEHGHMQLVLSLVLHLMVLGTVSLSIKQHCPQQLLGVKRLHLP